MYGSLESYEFNDLLLLIKDEIKKFIKENDKIEEISSKISRKPEKKVEKTVQDPPLLERTNKTTWSNDGTWREKSWGITRVPIQGPKGSRVKLLVPTGPSAERVRKLVAKGPSQRVKK